MELSFHWRRASVRACCSATSPTLPRRRPCSCCTLHAGCGHARQQDVKGNLCYHVPLRRLGGLCGGPVKISKDVSGCLEWRGFQKIRGPFWGPYHEDPSVFWHISWPLIFANPQFTCSRSRLLSPGADHRFGSRWSQS